MPLEPLTGFVPLAEAGTASHLFTDLQPIRILVYTDDPSVTKDEDVPGKDNKGIFHLDKFLKAHQPTFGQAELLLKHRDAHSNDTAQNKLTDLLPNGGYDQIWFFGLHLSNLSQPNLATKETSGGPESELTFDELTELGRWMETRGVLVTGDHSVGKSSLATPSTLKDTLSLGRALSSAVPRASQLRTWDEGPATDATTSVNTHEPNLGLPLDREELQSDKIPQRIVLLRYDITGRPDPTGDFHNLFKDRKGWEIDVFPDHMHEGRVSTPATFNPSEWPGSPPRVIAVGIDKRNGEKHNMVVVYDGHTGDPPTGRIVADSTWHHYFNENLRGFTDTSEDSVADRIGQYYGNLAVWLSPPAKRQKMA